MFEKSTKPNVSIRKIWTLIAVMGLALFAVACGGDTTPAPAEPEAASTDSEMEAAESTESEAEMVETASDEPIVVEWWSHWINEPSKREVIETIAADYQAANPNVVIELTWWDKPPLIDAFETTMATGEGAPDIIMMDTESISWATDGWVTNIEDALPWENFVDAARSDGRYPGLDGVYKFNIGTTVDMLLYNPTIFAELGIEVPEDFQFTQSEFVDVVKTCADAGYAGIANAIGNRDYTARFVVEDAMMNLVGPEEYGKYLRGEQSWQTADMEQILNWTTELRDAGLWSDEFATMGIDEFHVYFHTEQKACMMYIPTWYTGRSFKEVAEGGQSPDFRLGMLRYPQMDNARANDAMVGGFESGYAVVGNSDQMAAAKDILAFASQPKYGALWTAVTNSPSAIKFEASDLPQGFEESPWQWYWDEFDMVYGDMQISPVPENSCQEFTEAMVATLNEGLPQNFLSVEEAITILDGSLCNGS